MQQIPPFIIESDRRVNELLKKVSFSQYLNPVNADEARFHFFQRSVSPPFAYNHLTDADEYLQYLDQSIPLDEHPLSEVLRQKIYGLQLLIIALRDRTTEAFDNLARHDQWYPTEEDLRLDLPLQFSESQPSNHSAQELISILRKSLAQRNLHDWSVLEDPVMTARVLVDGAKKVLRVHPNAKFKKNDLDRLVVHEIDVHAMRSHCGEKQSLRCFSTGLPQSLLTEEGLAMVAEEKTGLLDPNSLQRQQDVVRAIHWGRNLGFRALYEKLLESCSSSLSWAICQRIKRGLSKTDEPGVYAKDSVYLRGWWKVSQWLNNGGNIDHLYVGKVGLHHPIKEWQEHGWIKPCRAPLFWKNLS